jgi:hypothetical protein
MIDFPASPSVGDQFTFGGFVWEWDGIKWTIVPGASGPPVTISDTPPASPAVGDLWWDSVGGQTYLWMTDATSSQWVPATNTQGAPGPAGPTGSAGPAGPAGPNMMPPGVTDGSDAAAGQVGEVIVNYADSVNFNTNMAPITLPAGDWEITGFLSGYLQYSTTPPVCTFYGYLNGPTDPNRQCRVDGMAGSAWSVALAPYRFSLTASTAFSISTGYTLESGGPVGAFPNSNCSGWISARRMR